MDLGKQHHEDLEQRLKFMKERAATYADRGDVDRAMNSLMADLRLDEDVRSRLSSVRLPTFEDHDTTAEKVVSFKRWMEQLRVCPS